MSNLNKIYHKSRFRGGEWCKHLRPYLKRAGNKRWRKTGKNLPDSEEPVHWRKTRAIKKTITVRITTMSHCGCKTTRTEKYRTLRDAENAMKRAHVTQTILLKPK